MPGIASYALESGLDNVYEVLKSVNLRRQREADFARQEEIRQKTRDENREDTLDQRAYEKQTKDADLARIEAGIKQAQDAAGFMSAPLPEQSASRYETGQQGRGRPLYDMGGQLQDYPQIVQQRRSQATSLLNTPEAINAAKSLDIYGGMPKNPQDLEYDELEKELDELNKRTNIRNTESLITERGKPDAPKSPKGLSANALSKMRVELTKANRAIKRLRGLPRERTPDENAQLVEHEDNYIALKAELDRAMAGGGEVDQIEDAPDDESLLEVGKKYRLPDGSVAIWHGN
jgi:hypothetical protein